MLIGTRQEQLARIECSRFAAVYVEQRHRHAMFRRRRHQAADFDRRIETQQRKVWSERIVERSSVAQPQMWRAASRDRGLAEIVHGVAGRLLAVIGDNRG